MKPPKDAELSIHFMAIDTDWIEAVGDDDVFMLGAHIDNGEFGKDGSNYVELTINQRSTPIEALAWGGMAVFSNLKKETIHKALVTGLQFLIRTQQFDRNDVIGLEDEDDQEA